MLPIFLHNSPVKNLTGHGLAIRYHHLPVRDRIGLSASDQERRGRLRQADVRAGRVAVRRKRAGRHGSRPIAPRE